VSTERGPSRSGATVWDDTAGPATLAALAPGVLDDLDRHPDVLVVGGGLIGLATAACCTRARLGRVVVLERDRLGAGASGGAAALLTPEVHVWTDPAPFVVLGRASLDLYRRLDAEWNGALGVQPLDWLLPLPDLPAQQLDAGAGEVLDADATRAVEPRLAPVPGALLLRDQARVHPLRTAAALAARAGTVATGVEMVGLETRRDRVVRVRTSHGDFEPGAVVLATGTVTHWDVPITQKLVKGHLVATEPAPFRFRVALATPNGLLLLQLDDGRLVAGGTLDETDSSPDVRGPVIDVIRREIAALLPDAAGVGLSHRWCCFRPATADRQPVIDRLPGVANAWVTAGHYRTGILMAPATGDALARWIASGERPPEVEAFGIVGRE
jgi:glycine oxidase